MADTDTSNTGASTTQTTQTQTTQPTNLIDSIPADTASAQEWYFADGVKGTGDVPEYFNSKKYKTLADQAKAQRELEKKLGSFVGAPDKYEMPEGVTADDPYISKLAEFGKKHNMSQEAFAELVATDSADAAEYVKQQKAMIGADADKRIAAIAQWGKANLDESGFNKLKSAMSSAESFEIIERLVSMNRQAPLPRAGEDVPTSAGITPEAVRALHNEVDSQGRRKYDYDPDHRKKVKAAYSQLYGDQPYQEIR